MGRYHIFCKEKVDFREMIDYFLGSDKNWNATIDKKPKKPYCDTRVYIQYELDKHHPFYGSAIIFENSDKFVLVTIGGLERELLPYTKGKTHIEITANQYDPTLDDSDLQAKFLDGLLQKVLVYMPNDVNIIKAQLIPDTYGRKYILLNKVE